MLMSLLSELPKGEAYIFSKILSLWPLISPTKQVGSCIVEILWTKEGDDLSTMYVSSIYAGEPIETNYLIKDW